MRCGYNALLFTASARRARINSEKRQELAGVDKNATALIGNRKYKYSAEARKTRARERKLQSKYEKMEQKRKRVTVCRLVSNTLEHYSERAFCSTRLTSSIFIITALFYRRPVVSRSRQRDDEARRN